MKQKGFTLIELSIVLVIIGLIVGGVLVGQDLINAAKLRNLHSQAQQFNSAVLTFKLKYNGLPGDIPNATLFFGECQPGDNCNGNGDRLITQQSSPAIYRETFLAWQHLGLAEMIPGTYTGIGRTANIFFPKENVPSNNNFGGSGFSIADPRGLITLATGRHQFTFSGSENDRNATPILTPLDAIQLDQKSDDGKAGSGNILAYNARDGAGTFLTGCVDYGAINWTALTSEWDYDLSSNDIRCYISFISDF